MKKANEGATISWTVTRRRLAMEPLLPDAGGRRSILASNSEIVVELP